MPINRFHIRMTVLTFGAHFTDGYAMGSIALALAMIGPAFEINAVWQGLLGSSALIGIFTGSLIIGRISDKVGRQKIFQYSFLLITVAAFLQFFVHDAAQLFLLRFLIGFGIGGDYTVGITLLTEYVPSRVRGAFIAFLVVIWTVGYTMGTVIGYYLPDGGDTWRWLLASAAIPAVVVLILRIGVPESPRWLIRMGRGEEARKIIDKFFGENVYIEENEVTGLGFKMLWTKKYIRITLLVGLIWAFNNLAFFAMYTFLPTILASLGVEDNFGTSLFLNIILVVGALGGVWACHKLMRRTYSIWSFAISAAALLLMVFIPQSLSTVLVGVFAVFTFIIAAQQGLTQLYPAEVFPTEVRTSGLGVAVAMSRIGAAIGTFLLPIMILKLGLTITLLLFALVLVLGTGISIAWAPETKDLTLAEAGKGHA